MDTLNLVISKCAFLVLVMLLVGCASTPRRETVTAFRVFEVQGPRDQASLADATKAAMSLRADNLTAVTGTVPEQLPETPPSFRVNVRQVALPFGMTFAMPTVECKEPYVLLSNQGGFAAGGTSQMDAYTGCIYPYQRGTSIQLVLISTTNHPRGLQGLVNRAVKKLFGGNTGTAETYLDQIEGDLRGRLPEAHLVRTSKPAAATPP